MKRILKEVEDLQKGDLSGLGIYIAIDEVDVKKGKALLIGPEDTPYAHCPLIFSFEYPAEYPLVPPKVLIDTSDGITRFHPNLYTTGKVCLSILGTFSGPGWISTMRLETVLKSIYSLLTDNPITNEPGWEKYTLADPKASGFAEWVQYALIMHTVTQYRNLNTGAGSALWSPFSDVIMSHWQRNWVHLKEIIATKASSPDTMYNGLPYNMAGKTAWNRLKAFSSSVNAGSAGLDARSAGSAGSAGSAV